MTGYLDGLIARATGSPPAVVPRLPTAFEPPAVAPVTPIAGQPALAEDDSRSGLFEHPRPAERSPIAETQRRVAPPLPPPADIEPPLLPPPPPPARGDVDVDRLPATRTDHVAPAGAESAPASGVRRSPEGNPTVPATAKHPEDSRPPAAAQSTAPPREAPAIRPAVAVTTEPAPRAVPADPPPDPAPVVRVTIGRVEVRANFTPPPGGRPSAGTRPPRLSLEDYLKGRSGGGG